MQNQPETSNSQNQKSEIEKEIETRTTNIKNRFREIYNSEETFINQMDILKEQILALLEKLGNPDKHDESFASGNVEPQSFQILLWPPSEKQPEKKIMNFRSDIIRILISFLGFNNPFKGLQLTQENDEHYIKKTVEILEDQFMSNESKLGSHISYMLAATQAQMKLLNLKDDKRYKKVPFLSYQVNVAKSTLNLDMFISQPTQRLPRYQVFFEGLSKDLKELIELKTQLIKIESQSENSAECEKLNSDIVKHSEYYKKSKTIFEQIVNQLKQNNTNVAFSEDLAEMSKNKVIPIISWLASGPYECELLLMSAPPQKEALNSLPIANAAYVRVKINDQNLLFYVNKTSKECTRLNISCDGFDQQMKIEALSIGQPRKLSEEDLSNITLVTQHIRADECITAFWKEGDWEKEYVVSKKLLSDYLEKVKDPKIREEGLNLLGRIEGKEGKEYSVNILHLAALFGNAKIIKDVPKGIRKKLEGKRAYGLRPVEFACERIKQEFENNEKGKSRVYSDQAEPLGTNGTPHQSSGAGSSSPGNNGSTEVKVVIQQENEITKNNAQNDGVTSNGNGISHVQTPPLVDGSSSTNVPGSAVQPPSSSDVDKIIEKQSTEADTLSGGSGGKNPQSAEGASSEEKSNIQKLEDFRKYYEEVESGASDEKVVAASKKMVLAIDKQKACLETLNEYLMKVAEKEPGRADYLNWLISRSIDVTFGSETVEEKTTSINNINNEAQIIINQFNQEHPDPHRMLKIIGKCVAIFFIGLIGLAIGAAVVAGGVKLGLVASITADLAAQAGLSLVPGMPLAVFSLYMSIRRFFFGESKLTQFFKSTSNVIDKQRENEKALEGTRTPEEPPAKNR
jgi:hypothetical protein